MAGLFDAVDEARRDRLRARGWRPAGGTLGGAPLWRDPDTGALLLEAEAFARLERAEVIEQDHGD